VTPAAVQTPDTSERRPVVVLGASYAAGWKLAEVDGVPVVNAGVAGEQSFELLARFDTAVVPARPRAVVLWGFINDFFRANDWTKASALVRESYGEMIKRARAQGIEPIIATEVTIRPPKSLTQSGYLFVASWLGKVSYQDQINTQVMEINRWLRDVAQREGLLLLDLQAAVGDTDGRRKRAYAVADGSHISEEGYDALTAYARPLLSNRLRPARGTAVSLR
jgi:lysophospholipase L1-like esterase